MFNFQDETPVEVDPDVELLLEKFQDELDNFAEHEDLAEHLVDIYTRNDNEKIRALDHGKIQSWTSDFWQMRTWFGSLEKVVPYLIQELAKYQPKNMAALAKHHKFWFKRWRWSPKSYNPQLETAKKYLSVLKDLRKQLADCQEAARQRVDLQSESVGKFELYDSLGLSDAQKKPVITTLKAAAKALAKIGLKEFCYGKVTIVDSSKLVHGTAAFYSRNTDEVFLSPDLKGSDVRVLCHEIAHRVHTKLRLKSRTQILYQQVKNLGVWVTSYAKTSPEENFCEMVSFAAMGKLSDEESKNQLQAITPKLKLAYTYDRRMV